MGRVLAIDYGHKRMGMALSDISKTLATPQNYLPRGPKLMANLLKVCEENDVDTIVIGLPITLEGKEGVAADNVRKFAIEVATATQINPILVDERFSTTTASDLLSVSKPSAKRQKQFIDSAAAAVVLQHYLDQLKDSQ